MKSILALAVCGTLTVAAPISAQWLTHPTAGLPRTRDGKPNLSARAPKAQDGKPDLSGIWLPDRDPTGTPGGVENEVFPRYFIDVTQDLKPEAVPFQPWALALFKERLANEGKDDPIAHCQPSGVPAIGTIPLPYKIIQTPRLVVILYEENSVFRQVFLDGRRLPPNPEPRWMGYSTGRWEGDVLVVETTGFNDKSWLDRMGHPHSESLRVIERFRRRDAGHLDVQVTIEDPKTYTARITFTQKQSLLPDDDLLEYFCSENEKDVARFR